ncbi:MAG: thioredoxin family protein [Myxococcales bacterium]|nr:thioredoxin family protein [Myxococcales bacterium]
MTRFLCVAALVAAFTTVGCNDKQATNSSAKAQDTATTKANAEAPAEGTGDTKETPKASVQAAKVGEAAPDFELKDLDGKSVKLSDYKGKVVVLEWFNPGCPFVKAAHKRGSLVDTAKKETAKGVVWLAINSGAPGKQGHGIEANKQGSTEFGMTNPVLLDEDGKVGKAYGAKHTPHMFVIDKAGKLAYAGAIDNSPDGEGESPKDGKLINYVEEALSDIAAGKPVRTPTTEAYGCSVKYSS